MRQPPIHFLRRRQAWRVLGAALLGAAALAVAAALPRSAEGAEPPAAPDGTSPPSSTESQPAAKGFGPPELKAAASLILPGLGQAANGDWAAAGAHLGLYLVLANQYEVLIRRDDYIRRRDRTDADRNITINRTSFAADLYATALTDLSLYSAFGAYRDARQTIGNRGYATPAPRESLDETALAPFQWTYLSRATTFIPLLFALAGAVTPADSNSYVYRPVGGLTREEMAEGFALQFEMVAVGEEGFFRGVLNNSFSDAFGETWGLVGSSAVFGLAHTGAGIQASGLGATVFGLYLGWLQQVNDYDIRQGVAIHYWWDFLVALSTLQQRQARTADRAVRIAQVALRF